MTFYFMPIDIDVPEFYYLGKNCRFILKQCWENKMSVISDDLTMEQILQKIRKGFKFKVINELSNNFAVTKIELSKLLQIPPKTLNRRQQEGKLSFLESDRVLRFERIYRRTLDVFENREDALKWLKSEQRALSNKKPLEFCNSEIGAHEVQILLGRIEHGVYS